MKHETLFFRCYIKHIRQEAMWFLPYDFDINNFTNIKFGGEKFCKQYELFCSKVSDVGDNTNVKNGGLN